MAKNRLIAHIEDAAIANVAEVGARIGKGFDEALEHVVHHGLMALLAAEKKLETIDQHLQEQTGQSGQQQPENLTDQQQHQLGPSGEKDL